MSFKRSLEGHDTLPNKRCVLAQVAAPQQCSGYSMKQTGVPVYKVSGTISSSPPSTPHISMLNIPNTTPCMPSCPEPDHTTNSSTTPTKYNKPATSIQNLHKIVPPLHCTDSPPQSIDPPKKITLPPTPYNSTNLHQSFMDEISDEDMLACLPQPTLLDINVLQNQLRKKQEEMDNMVKDIIALQLQHDTLLAAKTQLENRLNQQQQDHEAEKQQHNVEYSLIKGEVTKLQQEKQYLEEKLALFTEYCQGDTSSSDDDQDAVEQKTRSQRIKTLQQQLVNTFLELKREKEA